MLQFVFGFTAFAVLIGLPISLMVAPSGTVFWMIVAGAGVFGGVYGDGGLRRVADSRWWIVVRAVARHWLP